jgi:hypothetical protein
MRQKSYVQLWQKILQSLAKEISYLQNLTISEDDIYKALIIKYSSRPDYVVPESIFFIEPNYDDLLTEFKSYNFKFNRIELEITIDEFSGDDLIKAQVKSKGMIWVIHLYDKDPFPSKPHAHNISNNLKLHLGTGDIYRKSKIEGSINKNELKNIRDLFALKGIKMPKLNI